MFASAVLLVAALFTTSAQAQYPMLDAGVISGNGVVVISRQPETMRVQIVVQGKGGTLKEAMASVKTRTEGAKAQAVKLGADKESVKVDSPRIVEQQADQQQMQMQRMMMQQMNQGKKKAKQKGKEAEKPAEPVLVSAQFTAEWKLDAKSSEDLLVAVHGLQEKIKSADLAGMKDSDKLTPEQEEMLEEMEAQSFGRYNSNEGPKPGEPVFLFVGRIAEGERDKALAEAFQKAKVQAARLSKAAGVELGGLKSLSARSTSGDANNYGYNNYNSSAYRMMQMARQSQMTGDDDDENSTEALGVEPGPVKFNVTVTAAFSLGEKK
jgi:uncharacterized protein YggE